ncbi:hypothetical protein FVEG_04681 [Fusarium verticillioides 7600]|uniref:Uncharacterized protein n=1 Tax=Gibberella moniliformis (strain M3125 / FGSC 7600) TaxID=334819 RepID=W7M6F4_GIBM7|nr:hypothetical protein FVEG_04681 [Fusarium verticillioides 7600]EWG43039.1 hypothetical protein FVEG_04681 [Fusarium verticillioides 7600]
MCVCRRRARKVLFSPGLLRRQGGSGFDGNMEEENFVTNLDTESYGLGELSGKYTPLSVNLSVCRNGTIHLRGPALTYFIDYRELRFRPNRLHRSRKIGVVFAGVSRSRATRKLNYEHNDLGINNTNKKEIRRKKEM